MSFGLGFLFDPFKNLGTGTNIFGAPGSNMMRAGMDDFGGAGSPPPGVGLTRAVGEGPASLTPPDPPPPVTTPPIVGHETPAPGPSVIAPPPGTPTTPTLSPAQAPTPPRPGESSAPLHPATATTPPPGGAGTAPSAAPGAAPAATPGTVPTTQVPGQTTLSKLADLGKALGSAGGQAAQKGGSIGSAGGDPAAASRTGSAQMLQDILKMREPIAPGPVPGLPPGLMQRFRGG